MKYFTPERYVRLQDRDAAAMYAADAAWETAVQQYDAYLQTILGQLPSSVRQLLIGYYLHDAEVISVSRQADAFIILLQLDAPPNELLSLSYTLTAEPTIDRAALPSDLRSPRMTWQYEELQAGGGHYLHSILFSNGWEIQVPFCDVRLSIVQSIYLCPRPLTSSNTPEIPQIS